MSYVVFGGSYPMFASSSTIKNAFERAIKEKNWRLLCMLIGSRNVNEVTSDGSIPLIFFLRHSKGANVDFIVKKFLDRFSEIENTFIDDKETHRESALIEMIGRGSVQYLIEKGAQVNFQDTKGETALHRAVLLNDSENILLLLQNGARPDLPRYEDKKTAGDLARIQEVMLPLFWQQAHRY